MLEKWGILVDFEAAGVLYKFSTSDLVVNMAAGLSTTYAFYKLFPVVWLFMHQLADEASGEEPGA